MSSKPTTKDHSFTTLFQGGVTFTKHPQLQMKNIHKTEKLFKIEQYLLNLYRNINGLDSPTLPHIRTVLDSILLHI